MDDMIIANTVIKPGERKRLELPIAQLPGQTMMSMPVTVIRGKKSGPVLWVSAALHGDEINGVEITNRILSILRKVHIQGSLIATPIVNVFGFTHQSRYLPDRRDLNRSFPGGKSGSLAARLAHLFVREIVSQASYGVDIHTGALHRCNFLHVRCDPELSASMDLARSFGPKVIIARKSGKGTLRAAATKLKIPSILIELGEALRFNYGYIEECTYGILRVMRSLGMIHEAQPPPPKDIIVAKKSSWLRARRGGLFHPSVEPGQLVSKGDLLGEVTAVALSRNHKLVANNSGVVIGITRNPLVYQGDALIHIAHVTDVSLG